MKMIDVLNMMAEGKIENNTELIADTDLDSHWYTYLEGKCAFFDKHLARIEEDFFLDKDFLNLEVELIPPKEKKYLVKFNMRGLRSDKDDYFYLNYIKTYEYVDIDDKLQTVSHKTHFTKDELQSIQPLKEFLDDMEGKYELIEVDENEID